MSQSFRGRQSVRMSICSCISRCHRTRTPAHNSSSPGIPVCSVSCLWSLGPCLGLMCLHHIPHLLPQSISHTVPSGCKEGVKDSARCLCANLAGWTDANAFQQPLSCCHSLPWGRSPHSSLVGRSSGRGGWSTPAGLPLPSPPHTCRPTGASCRRWNLQELLCMPSMSQHRQTKPAWLSNAWNASDQLRYPNMRPSHLIRRLMYQVCDAATHLAMP